MANVIHGPAQDPSQPIPFQADPVVLIKNLIITYAQKDLNVDVQSKAILALAQAVKLLHEANQPAQQGVDPQILAQIELQKAQADIQMKQVELQHKMKLREAELAARLQAQQVNAQAKQAEVAMKQEAHRVDQSIKVQQAEQSLQQKAEAHKKAMTQDTASKKADAPPK